MPKPKIPSVLAGGRVSFLPVGSIRPNPAQPRKIFDAEGLQELASSISQYGVLQPLTVRRRQDGFELVAGERRLRAAKLAGLREVPCLLVSVDELSSGMLALVENLQRRDLDFIEEAEGLSRLMRLYGLSQEQAAAKVGKSQSAVANKLRILRHPPEVIDAIRKYALSERHARALLRLEGTQARLDAIAEIVRQEMNVARAEQYIERLVNLQNAPKKGVRKLLCHDVRLFLNTVDHQLTLIRSAGFQADSQREETDEEIVLTIRLPKRATRAG